jgi:hypothetical protein
VPASGTRPGWSVPSVPTYCRLRYGVGSAGTDVGADRCRPAPKGADKCRGCRGRRLRGAVPPAPRGFVGTKFAVQGYSEGTFHRVILFLEIRLLYPNRSSYIERRRGRGVVSKLFSIVGQITDFCDRGQPRGGPGSPKLPYCVYGLGPGLAATGDRVVGGPSALSAIWLALETCLVTTPGNNRYTCSRHEFVKSFPQLL